MPKHNILGAAPQSHEDYQAEDDYRNLLRASEVLADRLRLKAAMRKFTEHRRGMDTMQKMLTSRKVSG